MSDRHRSIRVVVNGRERTLACGSTVAALLDSLNQDPRAVAVEYNGDILPRASYATTQIVEGDRLEVVHFVQGG